MKKEDKERTYELKKKSVAGSVWASLVVTGLGHAYLGQWGKATLYLVLQLALWIVLMGWLMWIITPIATGS